MPIQVQRHLCSTCRVMYRTPAEALSCEGLGVPEQRFQIGDHIQFELEQNWGGRWSYQTAKGTILYAFVDMLTNDQSSQHAWVYIVKSDNNIFEHLVLDTPDGLHCPTGSTGNTGVAASIQHEREFPQ